MYLSLPCAHEYLTVSTRRIFLRYGEPTAVTVWVPMGDIKLDGGGLIYLENGHTLGAEQEAAFTEQAKASGLTEEEAHNAFNQNMMSNGLLSEGPKEFAQTFNRRWLVAAYEAGDVVLHNPFAIHASTINKDPGNVIRLATDLRFVDSSKPWDTVSIELLTWMLLAGFNFLPEMEQALHHRGRYLIPIGRQCHCLSLWS